MSLDTAQLSINETTQQRIRCPHCSHHLFLTLDTSAGDQNYYEECPACCREIHLNMHIDEYQKKVIIGIDTDDEQIY